MADHPLQSTPQSTPQSLPQSLPLSISARAAARSADPAIAPYLQGLNPEQRAAVEALDGPVLVLAGAGTGKTRVLVSRLVHLLVSGRAQPWQILAVTFTNKAAREMRERVAHILGPSAEGLRWLGTFHSIANQILRRHCELVGLRSSFTILDTDDQIRLIKQILEAEGIDDKRWSAKHFAALVDQWKNRALTPENLDRSARESFAEGRAGALYQLYQDRLRLLNCCDFGDLLLHNIVIFQKHPDILDEWRGKFRFLMVDEYQDTNIAQYLWLRLLAQASQNLCVVGDDDQSIYGWRGAEIDNILRFERDFPGAHVVRLECNYRSTTHILSAASGLIAANQGRLGKTLWTQQDGGDKVEVRGLWDGEAEARQISDLIEDWKRGGGSYSDIAVLVRASWQMRAFEERFLLLGLPYKVIGGPRFFERAEIRDAHAYLRLVRQPDDDLAFERIVNQPKRGIGDSSVQKLSIIARKMGCSLSIAAQSAQANDEIRGAARSGLHRFSMDLMRWRNQVDETAHWALLEAILEESGYMDMLVADKSPQSQSRIDNLKELIEAMRAFDSLASYLEHVQLVMDLEQNGSEAEVQIMTLHAAKGLEFPLVFLPGWEETVFPSQRSLDEQGLRGLEEERRLAYVGLTRARERAVITFAANRQIYGRWQNVLPSRFIDELPEAHVEAISETGFSGALAKNMAAHGQESLRSTGLHAQGAGAAAPSHYDSPGWQRMSQYRAAAPVINASAQRVGGKQDDRSSEARFARGARVFHIKFGYGRVRVVEGNKLTIDFEKAGEKKVMQEFLESA